MLQHSNIDRADSVQVSKAPFTYESTLDMAGNLIPSGSFLSLKVYVEGVSRVPFRFHSIQPDGRVLICDSSGVIRAYWQTYATTESNTEYISSLIFNTNGIIAGHIACTQEVMSVIRHIVDTNTTAYLFPRNAFIFIPQCHISMLAGHGRAFEIISQNGDPNISTGDVHLVIGSTASCVIPTVPAQDGISISLSNTEDTIREEAPKNGLCMIAVNGTTYCCADSSIIFKSKTLSNLRVLKEPGCITFKGVLDA